MQLEKVLRWVVLGGVFLLPFIPLLVVNSLFFPFITGKNFAFRLIVEVMAAAWLSLALIRPEYRPRRSWLLGAFAIFVLIIGLADIFGANAFKSFWSNFERMEGWVTLAHLLAYFTIITSTLRVEKLWKRLFQTSIGVSILMGIYGIFQMLGFIIINQGGDRLDATFGNATYLAVYMLFHIFITALLWAHAWQAGRNRIPWSLGYGAIMLLQTFILLFTETRGAILGLFAGVFVTSALLVMLARHSRIAWRVSTGAVVGLLLLAGGFFLVKDQAWVQNVDPLARIASISLEQNTVQSRFMVWGMAWQGVQERPILGWGQENFNFVFNKHYDPGMFAQEPWFDRVHNIVLDWLIAGGILGFAAYASIYVIALYYLWFSGAFVIPERAIFTGLFAGYGFHNLFVFDNIVSYILFFTVLGYIAYRVIEHKNVVPLSVRTFIPGKALPIVVGVLVIVLGGTAWSVNASALAANRDVLRAVSPPPEGNIGANLEAFESAIERGTYGTQEAREHLAQLTSRILQNPNVPDEAKDALFEVASQEMQAQIDDVPEDARFPLFLGILLEGRGLHEEGRVQLERAHELSPTKQTILFQLAANALVLGETDAALEYSKEAFELDPAFDEALVRYVVVAITIGRDALVNELMPEVQARGLTTDSRILSAYVDRGRFDIVEALWLQVIQEDPTNIQAYFSLSAIYFSNGRSDLAIQALERAIQANPAVEQQANALIEQIRNGTAQLQ